MRAYTSASARVGAGSAMPSGEGWRGAPVVDGRFNIGDVYASGKTRCQSERDASEGEAHHSPARGKVLFLPHETLAKWLLSAAAFPGRCLPVQRCEIKSFSSALIAALVMGLLNSVLRPFW
jgi:hypothetical protein